MTICTEVSPWDSLLCTINILTSNVIISTNGMLERLVNRHRLIFPYLLHALLKVSYVLVQLASPAHPCMTWKALFPSLQSPPTEKSLNKGNVVGFCFLLFTLLGGHHPTLK